MALLGLLLRRPHERAGFALYAAAVSAAREPSLYGGAGEGEVWGVPDTLEGRFDSVALHAALLVRRLRRDPDPRGPALAQAVFDAMFSDMDRSLREMGVGDMSVPKRVKRMWEAFHGRALAYEAALDDADPRRLGAALDRNVWSGRAPEGAAAALAARARRLADRLAAQPLAELARGEASFGGSP